MRSLHHSHAAEVYRRVGEIRPASVPESYNVAPTQQVRVLRSRAGQPEWAMVRWGLVPDFTRGEPPKYSTINARIETFETAASYRGPWKRGQRALQLASGFYEWHLDETGRKAPYLITVADQGLFSFAGLWDRSIKDDSTAIESVVQITMPANELMADIHNTGNNPHRMPGSSGQRIGMHGRAARRNRRGPFWLPIQPD